ncbi:MAG: periplasmic heavy metal sensor [Paracoccaceae bacterium]
MSASTKNGGPEPKLRGPGWLWGALLLSVSLNLLGAGLLLGDAARPEERRRFTDEILGALPDHRQAEAREILSRRPAADAEIWQEMMAATERAIELFRAEPYDPEAYRAALEARSTVISRRFRGRNDRLVELGTTLDVEERAIVAAIMGERSRRWMERMQRRSEERSSQTTDN